MRGAKFVLTVGTVHEFAAPVVHRPRVAPACMVCPSKTEVLCRETLTLTFAGSSAASWQ